ncbi:MAG TPA: flagellin [Planctomycetota bacterium]|nr:flagellin [Planctomycetota bacterium]
MGLRINNNIAALTAQRYLGRNNDAMTVSLERLSSGMRINRAADNPAGLVTSEKQRAQIAGLNQAIENTERGVSMIQTAEAALTEINSLLTKVRGLALDSANTSVNDADSLAANQAEIDDALASIDRIAATAQFGSRKLLDGSNRNSITVTDGTNGMDLSFDNSTLATGTDTVTISGFVAASYTVQNAATIGINGSPSSYGLVGVKAGDHTVEVTQASNYATLTGTEDITNSGITLAAADTMALTVSGTNETITMAGGGTTIAEWVAAINTAIDASTNFSTTVVAGKKLVSASAGAGNEIVFKTGNTAGTAYDEGGTAAVTVGVVAIANGGTAKTAADIGFGSGNTSASGTNAIVEFDGRANTISFTNGNGTTASTIYDTNSNAVSITPGATGLNAGTAILTVVAATGNIGLSGGTAVAFAAGIAITVTDANGKTVDISVGEDITADGTEGITAVNNALVFQIGANNNQTVSIGLDDTGSDQLATNVTNTSGFTSLSRIDVTTSQGAQDTLLLVDEAVTRVANIRSELGSFQANTLQSNLNNLTVASENMTAAESVLRDTDFAAEMAEFTKNQILVQAGMTVLANAAQMPQSVLTLLR